MRNSRCSIEHSTLNIEHYGHCRFTHKSRVSPLQQKFMNHAGWREAGKVNELAGGLARLQSYTALLEVAAGSHE